MYRVRLSECNWRELASLGCNAINCLLLSAMFFACCAWTGLPMTVDVMWQLIVTETALRRTKKKMGAFEKKKAESISQLKSYEGEKLASALASDDADQRKEVVSLISTVVGWREEKELFEACLKSYKTAEGSKFLIVGVDGDSAEDMAMVDIYEQVYEDAPTVLYFKQPLGEMLESYDPNSEDGSHSFSEKENEVDKLEMICQYVRNALEEHLLPNKVENLRHICIYQPHRSKKDILFSAFIVGLVVGEILGIEYLWGSDSDSVVFPETLQRTVRPVYADKRGGGASARLKMVNKNPTAVAKMIAAKYWFDQDTIRAQTAACNSSECQPGPCTIFRITALREMVVPWYQQRIFGKRMIANEDRHLTTNLLHRGWKVFYVSNTSVLTDAPMTVMQWLKQQVRWGRGTHIERFERPIIYLRKSPIFFLHVWKEEAIPLIAGYNIIEYLIRGHASIHVPATDFVLRVGLQVIYTLLRSHESVSRDHMIWLLPSLLFHSIPGPGIHTWSLLTAFESSWGTVMRGSLAGQKRETVRDRWYQVGFHVVWMAIMVGFCTRLFTTQITPLIGVGVGVGMGIWLLPASMLIAGVWCYWSFFWDLHILKA